MSETWTLDKEFRFEASHQLMHHDGKCARLHGHSWVGRVIISGHALETDGPKRGMLMDYTDISAIVKPMVETFLDHYHLNDTLKTDTPTSEMVAQWVWQYVNKELKYANTLNFAYKLSIAIEETCTSRCTYTID